MITNLICFLAGVIFLRFLNHVTNLGHSINVLNGVQQSCATLFIASEQGLQEVLQLKYIAMEEAERTEQNIRTQKYIDQLNIDSVKKSIMKNYILTFPGSFSHLIKYNNWEELEEFVNKTTQRNKEAR